MRPGAQMQLTEPWVRLMSSRPRDHGAYDGPAREPRAELGPGAAANPGLWCAGCGAHPTARAEAESGTWEPEQTSEGQLVRGLLKPLKITSKIFQQVQLGGHLFAESLLIVWVVQRVTDRRSQMHLCT